MRAVLTILAGVMLSVGVAFALFLSLALTYGLINMGIGLSDTFEEAADKGLVFSGVLGWMWWFDGWLKKRRAQKGWRPVPATMSFDLTSSPERREGEG